MSSEDDKFNDENSLDKTSVVPSDTFKIRIAQANEAPPCLVLLVGPAGQVGRQWPLQSADIVIGRSVTNQVFVDDRSVSKSHAKVMISNGEVRIMDLESTNKTVINTSLLDPLSPYKLKNNDQIKMGNIIFKFLEKGNIEAVSTAQTFDRGQIDALTQIYNKGALDRHGPEAFKKSRILGVPLTVITFDIDHFKVVNDTYGHPAGDHVLIELSKVIKDKLIRENDFFSRSGGEEYTIILLGSPMDQVKEIANRIRKTIEEHKFVFEGIKIPITISIGVSAIVEADEEWKQIFDRADKALYHSKKSGRNRVTVSGEY